MFIKISKFEICVQAVVTALNETYCINSSLHTGQDHDSAALCYPQASGSVPISLTVIVFQMTEIAK